MNLPESFIINNDCYHSRGSANITFERITEDGKSAAYKRTKDIVQQYSYSSLTTSDKWAVKYYVTPERKRNSFFKTRKSALAFLSTLTK